MKRPKEQIIEQLLRGVWSSMESHLEFMHKLPKNAQKVEQFGGKNFHKRTVKEYGEMMYQLTQLL